MARTPTPAKKPVKPAVSSRPARPTGKASLRPPSKPSAPKTRVQPPARRPAPAVRAAAKPAARSAPAGKAAPAPAKQAKPAPGQVDPLLDESQGRLMLVGGHERDAQLPTTLVPKPDLPATVPLTIHAQAVPGAAQHGNSQPANILVLVSCGGWPVADLNEDHFSVMEHFEVPGQTAPFSSNIVSFRNNGSGAYLIQVRPIGGAPWAAGQHLAQILVSSPDERHGQTAAKLIIR